MAILMRRFHYITPSLEALEWIIFIFFYIVRVINVYGPIQSYLELNKGHNKSYTQITRAYRLTLFRYRKETEKSGRCVID